MRKRYILILLLVCLFGGLYAVEKMIQEKEKEIEEPFKSIPISTVENDTPESQFKDLQMIYYGKNEKYRLETNLASIVQEKSGNMNFKGLTASLLSGPEVLQKFSTNQGWLLNKEGVVHLNGPIVLKAGNYQIAVNTVNIDLNKGYFKAHGAIDLVTPEFEVHAREMSSDFQLGEIHFGGRPRLIIKKGG